MLEAVGEEIDFLTFLVRVAGLAGQQLGNQGHYGRLERAAVFFRCAFRADIWAALNWNFAF